MNIEVVSSLRLAAKTPRASMTESEVPGVEMWGRGHLRLSF